VQHPPVNQKKDVGEPMRSRGGAEQEQSRDEERGDAQGCPYSSKRRGERSSPEKLD